MPVSPEIQEYIAKYGKQQPSSDVSFDGYNNKEAVSPEVQSYIDSKKMNKLEKAGAWGLRGAQLVGGMLPAGLSAISTTPATEYAIQRLEKKTPQQAESEAAKAAAIDAAVSVASAGLPIIGGIGKGLAKAGI